MPDDSQLYVEVNWSEFRHLKLTFKEANADKTGLNQPLMVEIQKLKETNLVKSKCYFLVIYVAK